MALRCRGATVDLSRVAIMGILNVTPDSFSDGGRFLDAGTAIAHGRAMMAAGAAIIDVGGESTRPGADPVAEEEELRRVLPVVEGLASGSDIAISIDTRKAGVARRAIAAGATIINDTTGEATDESLDRVAADSGVGVVLMHSRGTPATMRSLTDYKDVVTDVAAWLARRAAELQDAGVQAGSIALDPGIGFAKTPAHNLALLKGLGELASAGYPVAVGTSRKSVIGAVLDLPEAERLEGTIATVCWAVGQGARIVRVHDVKPAVRAVRMTEAILRAEPEGD